MIPFWVSRPTARYLACLLPTQCDSSVSSYFIVCWWLRDRHGRTQPSRTPATFLVPSCPPNHFIRCELRAHYCICHTKSSHQQNVPTLIYRIDFSTLRGLGRYCSMLLLIRSRCAGGPFLRLGLTTPMAPCSPSEMATVVDYLSRILRFIATRQGEN